PARQRHLTFQQSLTIGSYLFHSPPIFFPYVPDTAASIANTYANDESLRRAEKPGHKLIAVPLPISDVDHTLAASQEIPCVPHSAPPALELAVLPLRRRRTGRLLPLSLLCLGPLGSMRRLGADHSKRPAPGSSVHDQGKMQPKSGLPRLQI